MTQGILQGGILGHRRRWEKIAFGHVFPRTREDESAEASPASVATVK
jgi:hypothetical protein